MGNLFVHPQEQRKGIGTAMLVECENLVRKKFNTVNIYSYKSAVPLHQKRGYTLKNKSNLLMEKKL